MNKLINIYNNIQDKSMSFEEFVERLAYTYCPSNYEKELEEVLK